MTSSKHNRHVVIYAPHALVDEIQRQADIELIERASWMKRALLNEVNRLRKLRGEDLFMIKLAKRGAKAKDSK